MKICRFQHSHVGIVEGDTVHDITALFDELPQPQWPYPDYDWVVGNIERLRDRIAKALPEMPQHRLRDIQLEAPVANPGKIIGAPVNYRDHIEEAKADEQISYSRAIGTLEDHGLFIKAGSALLGPGGQIERPFADRRTDHEVELGVVIGKAGRRIKREQALDHVFGYCVALDMTVRGPEFPGFRKSADTFAVIGPWITTADEVADPNALDLSLKVNDEVRQQSNTRYLILNIQRLIEYASAMYSLKPGDVIMTGTPAGVGPVVSGDRIDATVQGLGDLTVTVQ